MTRIGDELQQALNDQIQAELASAYLYLAMAAYFDHRDLSGFAAWMRRQSREEVAHGMRIFDFVSDRGGRVVLESIQKPPTDFDSPLAVMRASLDHERKVTGMIHRLYELASEEGDYSAQVMLHWFIDEQVEEERTVAQIVGRLEIVGDQGAGLLMMDRDLGSRGEGG